jgi:hypothetical protein
LPGFVFGIGCDAQNDLTENGATPWLQGIPTWARQTARFTITQQVSLTQGLLEIRLLQFCHIYVLGGS